MKKKKRIEISICINALKLKLSLLFVHMYSIWYAHTMSPPPPQMYTHFINLYFNKWTDINMLKITTVYEAGLAPAQSL
jgi:hypothetical protein